MSLILVYARPALQTILRTMVITMKSVQMKELVGEAFEEDLEAVEIMEVEEVNFLAGPIIPVGPQNITSANALTYYIALGLKRSTSMRSAQNCLST